MSKLTQSPEWQALTAHHADIADAHMRSWFAKEPQRFNQFSIEAAGIFFDYSKNRLTQETRDLLIQLANAQKLPQKITELFQGQPLNQTEQRPVLHMALRNFSTKPLCVAGKDVMPAVLALRMHMQKFVAAIHQQTWLGATGKPIKYIVNVGIGGSDLGPKMAVQALADYAVGGLRCLFISNVDQAHTQEIFQQVEAERTLFIISSKSFSTLETMVNAHNAKTWLLQQLGTSKLSQHFVAITAEKEKARAFGILEEHIFPMWDWVGGRYSIWSAIGLPLALMVGMDQFQEFLLGAYEMDQHFTHSPFTENIPVLMALLSIWYINFFGAKVQAVVPYAHRLHALPAYLQQAEMESNGKTMTHQGHHADYASGAVLFGEQGCNGQHAYHQLLHQGQHFIPVDFILVGQGRTHRETMQNHILLASGLSQAQALMQGKSIAEIEKELLAGGATEDQARYLAAHKYIPGNRPSNIFFLNELTPRTLGALLALYEHKIFVEGVIWDINSFDQWGVELGKQLLMPILDHLQNNVAAHSFDGSTKGLIEYYKKRGNHA